MSGKPSADDIIEALLERHGRTYAAELGIRLERGTPSVLYRWLCAATLLSARISADIAMAAAKELADHGWTTARKMAESTWEQRTRVLNHAGYARYDESTARMLGDTAAMLIEFYGGDLRRLRAEAEQDPAKERALLKRCKGIGDVGVDIFLREAQAAWHELQPFLDQRALGAAKELGLPGDAKTLAAKVGRHDLSRLGAALVRMSLAKDAKAVLAAAGGD